MPDPESRSRPPRLGISSCLLGHRVRWDGAHKRDAFLADRVGKLVEWVAVCPEVELGLGTPRPPMQLVREDGSERFGLFEVESGRDHTRAMRRYSAARVKALRGLELSGYVLKSRSPSCGIEGVPVWETARRSRPVGRGLFAEALAAALPELPIEDEARLGDPASWDNFIERVFAYRRLRMLFRGRWTAGGVVAFHTAHKLQLMAHSPEGYRALGRMVAGVRDAPRPSFRCEYTSAFMAALSRSATPGRHTNALQHAAGYLKKRLAPAARTDLEGSIQGFRRGELPLLVPVSLLRHYARVLGIDYLTGQTYLEPEPAELLLR